VKVVVGDYAVEWKYIGEGYWGDFDPSYVGDEQLLRASLSYKGVDCRDGSYCTLAAVGTAEAELRSASEDLVALVTAAGGAVEGGRDGPEFPRRVMEEWTWRKYPLVRR